MKVYEEVSGKVRDSEDIALAEKIVYLRKKNDPWLVIDVLITAWAKRFPDEQEALMVSIKDQKETLFDPKFAQTKEGKAMERRFILIFPLRLQSMIRTQYNREELPFDSAFFKKFALKYKAFQLPEKL